LVSLGCRPLRGLVIIVARVPWGLRARLYAAACSAGCDLLCSRGEKHPGDSLRINKREYFDSMSGASQDVFANIDTKERDVR
jgi:hypothetical protein